MTEQKTAAELAIELKASFDKNTNEVKAMAEEALGKAKAGEELGESLKGKIDEALVGMNATKAQLTELEQKLARQNPGDPEEKKSLGQQFVESDSFKAFQQSGFSKSQRASMSVKATITLATTDAAGSVGDGAWPTRLPGVQALPQRRMTIRQLISPGRMTGNTLSYVQEKGFTNNAAPVAEGAAKPQSDIQLVAVDTSAKVIAHWMKVSRQALDDVDQLQSMIDQRLRYGLAFKEELQLLNGDGTGQNLHGIIPQATAFDAAFVPDEATVIDTLRLAILQAALAEYPATGTVLHPTDWAQIELTKDTTGRYIIGNPQGDLGPMLWGLPVVPTQAIAQGKFLAGAFALGAQLFDRWDARVETGYDSDDFTKNLVTMLGEERLALAVYRPQAFVYGDIAAVTAG